MSDHDRASEERAWEVVKRAYGERTPMRRHARNRRPLLVLAAVTAAVVASVASPPGRAVFQQVREAVGVEHADPALFSLPSRGRMLVVSSEHGGVWLVHDNGLKRRIGSYDDAQWSPHGLYVVATTPNALVALDLDEGVRWSLPRRSPTRPRWEGTRVDTRIAYLTAGGLRVVGGNGAGDRLLDADAQTSVAPAWDPGRLHTVAYVARGAVVLRHADTGKVVWRVALAAPAASLRWTSDGRYLVVVAAHRIVVLDATGKAHRIMTSLQGRFLDAAFQPGTHRLALSTRSVASSEVRLLDLDRVATARRLFAGPGSFADLVWSPDGKWLLVAWPTADQWVFIHGVGVRVRAVGNIEEQFPRADRRSPLLELDGRWCCTG